MPFSSLSLGSVEVLLLLLLLVLMLLELLLLLLPPARASVSSTWLAVTKNAVVKLVQWCLFLSRGLSRSRLSTCRCSVCNEGTAW